MLYHVIRRPPNHTTTNSSNQSRSNHRSGSVPTSTLMPRYHYSRIIPNSATKNSDSNFTRNNFDGHSSMTATTASDNNNNNNSDGSFKSTFIPLITNNRTMTPNKREFVQIPITREDGASIKTNNLSRSVPITYVSETTTLPLATNNENINPKPNFTNLLRPSSKFFQHHFNNNTEEPTITTPSIPHLPPVSRRLSLTIPVMTTTNTDNDTTKQTIPSSPIRQIPIRFPQATTAASIPTNSSRISSAFLRSSPLSNSLQRQKTDIGDMLSSSSSVINNPQPSVSDFTVSSSTPIRRAEVMAREAIQGIARLQQQRNSLISENNNRSPSQSRRVIINLKNNQSVSLDSRLSSALKPPQTPLSSRSTQRNNLYHIPVLHEIQMPPHPVTIAAETSLQSSSANHSHNGSYKNEFHMEIPVTITTSNDQENQIQQQSYGKEDGITVRERIPSAHIHSNQALKSILKRSSSRETVSRKNVSFMNA